MPAVYIHAYSLISHLGTDPQATLRALCGDKDPHPETAPGALPANALDDARVFLQKALPDTRATRGLLTNAALLLPILKRLASITPAKNDVTALVIGNATSGLLDVADDLKNNAAAPACWQNLELGRPAALLARAAETIAPIRGPAYVVSTACTAGAKALAEGARLLFSGAASSVIAGGADILNPFTDAGFRALGAVSGTTARPFAADRDGLHLGEGGALFLLSLSPQLDGRPALAKLSGWGETGDAHHISAPEPEGRGAEAAMRRALEKAACPPDALSFVFLHGTATEQNDRAESAALARVAPDVPAASFKHLVGHQLAGAGAFGAALALAMIERGPGPAPRNFATPEAAAGRDASLCAVALTDPASPDVVPERFLVNAFAFGGSNISLVIERLAPSR